MFTANLVIGTNNRALEKAEGDSGKAWGQSRGIGSPAQPQMTFAGTELYPAIVEKAAALGFSLINNRPFVERETSNASSSARLVTTAASA